MKDSGQKDGRKKYSVLLISDNDGTKKELLRLDSKSFANIVLIRPYEITKTPLPEAGSSNIVILECDYSCSLDKCLPVFKWVLCDEPEVHFLILKPALFDGGLAKSFWICQFEKSAEAEHQSVFIGRFSGANNITLSLFVDKNHFFNSFSVKGPSIVVMDLKTKRVLRYYFPLSRNDEGDILKILK